MTVSGYEVSCDPDKLDFAVICGFIASSYWAKGIPEAVMRKAIANLLCFGVYTAAGQQVGFARIISDRATFAYLADVFISPEHRGLGLSKWLVQTIVAHPELQGLRRMMLATRDAHGLYAQFGFNTVENPQSLMQIWQPDVYRLK
ncbi:GNAT family N-acetyltransferase [Shewanella sp. A32]|uniref:GNAT family N-acetyltransferase n=1 Tax=Shewanella sp. A32 TaxID=3031327 RepID=UPI0023B9FC91|nr:GNAT family N-acetyltransferase [Shewanella sp. A32]MDF0534590.1 GNAT family N-acetyltransferase [Shewanella sp. A32]